MKKLVIAIIAALVVSLNVNAQSIQFGAKAGVNFANFTGDVADTEIRTSFHVGGVVEFGLSEMFALQPELLYSSQGNRRDAGGDGIITSKLDYLNIPLTGKIYITDWLNIQVAPQIGLLINADRESDNEQVVFAGDFKEDFKNIDFGLKVGAGYKFSSGLFFDAHYNLGVVNINDITGNTSN